MSSMLDIKAKAAQNSQSSNSLREQTQRKIQEMQAAKQEAQQKALQECVDNAAPTQQENTDGTLPLDELNQKYEWEHKPEESLMINGFNLTDSAHRRRLTANENVKACQEELLRREIESEKTETEQQIQEDSKVTENIAENNSASNTNNNPSFDSMSEEELFGNNNSVEDDIEKEVLGEVEERGGNQMNEDAIVLGGPQRMATPEQITDIEQLRQKEEPMKVNTQYQQPKPVLQEGEMEFGTSPYDQYQPQQQVEEEINEESSEEVTIGNNITPVTTTVEEPHEHNHEEHTFVQSPVTANVPEMKPADKINLEIDEKDYEDIAENLVEKEVTEDEMKAAIEQFKKDLAAKLEVTPEQDEKVIPLNVSKSGVSLSSMLSSIAPKVQKAADWVLVSAGKRVTMKSWSGVELDAINRSATGRNRFNVLREIFSAIYDHILSEKPSFLEWLKNTSFFDIEHYYMSAYAASFAGKNYIPYNCEDAKCRKPFISDNKPIESMVWFANDAAKDRFYKIKESSDIEDPCMYKKKIEPIYGSIGIGFKEPSIYDAVFESAVLDENFAEKYKDIIKILVYIDGIYCNVDGEWHPLTYNIDPKSIAKTTKTKIVTYAKLLNSLPSDAFQKVVNIINNIDILGNSVRYVIPEEVCPYCGKPVAINPENNITDATELLFSRHQVSQLLYTK